MKASAAAACVHALEPRLLFAGPQTEPPVGFFSSDIQQPGLAPVSFNALPTLNDASAALVKEQLVQAQALGKTLAVRVNQPLTTKAAVNTFDQFAIPFVFADFVDAAAIAETKSLADQVLASRLSSAAAVGNFNVYPNGEIDPTRPASLAGSQAPRFTTKPAVGDYDNARSSSGGGNNQMGNAALWPGSPDYRNPAQGNSGAPNIRSALFTLPIQRETLSELGLRGLTGITAPDAFALAGRPNATDDLNIPNITRFDNYGNPALGGGPSGTGFVQNAATPSNGQLLSRGDFQAQVLHYRLRGALSVNLQPSENGSVVGYSEAQEQADVKTGWSASSVVNGIAGREDYSLANLTNTIGDSGADSGDVNPRSTELAGAVWSGIYDNAGTVDPSTLKRRLSILMSNLSAVQKVIDLPDIGGFSTFKEAGSDGFDAPDDYVIQPGQHRLLNFALQTSSRGMLEWVFTGDQFIGLDNNRNGVGVGGPGQPSGPAGTVQFGSLKISNASPVFETNVGQALASFLVTRSGNTSSAVTVDYITIGGTATSGIDFDAGSGQLSFNAGQATRTIFVKVNGDTAPEPDETFSVILVNPVNTSIEYDQGTGTIVNDDDPAVVPVLNSITVGDGSASRSQIRRAVLSFDRPVILASGAVRLVRLNTGGSGANDGSPPTDASTVLGVPATSNGGKTWVFTFVGGNPFMQTSGGADTGSLVDGVYRLDIDAAKVTANGVAMAAPAGLTFHRLFADINGSQSVNTLDFAQFRNAFGKTPGQAGYNAEFDFDGNGLVNTLDFGEFRKRFGKSLTY